MSKKNNFYGSKVTDPYFYRLDGVDEEIDIGDESGVQSSDFTFYAKVKHSGGASNSCIFSNQFQFQSGYRSGWRIRFTSNLLQLTSCYSSTGFSSALAGGTFTSPNDYYILITKSGLNINFWVNGGLNSSRTLSTGTINYSSNKKTIIGSWLYDTSGTTVNNFNGDIKDVKLWNRVLTNLEIADVFNGVPVTSGMLGDWIKKNDTWDGSSWNVVDAANGYNGTSVNMEFGDRVKI